MRGIVAAVVLVGSVLGGAPAWANMCKAEKLSCATQMPVGGYCECTAHGTTESGTVMAAPAKAKRPNSTAGGCGAHPQSPGCK